MPSTVKLELPFWMVERIVAILSRHPSSVTDEISEAIRKQVVL